MRLILAALILLTSSTGAFACPTATEPSFNRMIEESTLILRGQVFRVTGSSRGFPAGTTQYASDIVIERVYKGVPQGVIHVSWTEYATCPRAYLGKDQYGLFFLRANGSELVLADDTYGMIPISRWQDNAPDARPLDAIERDLKLAIQKDSGRQLIEDVSLLGSLRRPIKTAELHALLPTGDAVLESTVHLALLKLHDYSQLEIAGKLVETVPESRSFTLPAQEALSIRTEIGSAIMQIEEPEQLPVLQRFALSSNHWLRRNAAYALRHSHDVSNVSYLMNLIDDRSPEIRIQAMRGLQELLRPGVEGYGWVTGTPLNGKPATDEEVIARWHAWWQAEGQQKYGRR